MYQFTFKLRHGSLTPTTLPPQALFSAGPLRVRFYVPGLPTAPAKQPLPYPATNHGGGLDHDVWTGAFDSLDQLLEYWPDAFCLEIIEQRHPLIR